MGNYNVCVKNMETYIINEVESEEKAIICAINHFKNDDMYYGTKEAENVTVKDCEIIWYEEI